MRTTNGWFSTRDVQEVFEAFRVPPPRNPSDALGKLAVKDLVYRRTEKPPWSLTPKGRKIVSAIMGDLDPGKLESQLADAPGAELADVRQPVLPPELAPPRWAAGIKELLARSPFETNALCMTRFPKAGHPDDPIQGVIDTIKAALAAHGLTLHLASDAIVEDTLFANVAAYMWACQYGFALFEDRIGLGLNYNLVIEVGAMIMAGRQTALLRDTTIPNMPTDLVGHIYKPVDFGDLATVNVAAHQWAADDIGLGRCKSCP